MTNIKIMPKDTLAELLRYLAEHEDFSSVETLAVGDITPTFVKAALRELADELCIEAAREGRSSYDVKGCKNLSKEAKNVISCLSPSEEKRLLTRFGLIDPHAAPSTPLGAGKK